LAEARPRLTGTSMATMSQATEVRTSTAMRIAVSTAQNNHGATSLSLGESIGLIIYRFAVV
jgi:hypothetical protein